MDIESSEHRQTLYTMFRGHVVTQCVNGTAHDLNNLLGAILSYSELIELTGGLPEESQRMLEQIATATQRGSVLVQSLTEVARQERPGNTMLDIGSFVDHALNLRRYDFRIARIELAYEKSAGERTVVVHKQRFEMALLYLLANAYEAVVGTEKPVVRVKTFLRDEDVLVSVWNSGAPVPAADRERMFEPFFTTKGPGHFGLGLPFARDIAREHDGDLVYDETDGFLMRVGNIDA